MPQGFLPTNTHTDYPEAQLRLFRIQAQRALQETAYYQQLFVEHQIDPSSLTRADIMRLPLTTRETLVANPTAFVSHASQPTFCATSAGTTGRLTTLYFSAQELESYAALTAMRLLAHGEVTPEDIVQISASSRATLPTMALARACERIGALYSQTALIDPKEMLGYLAQRHHLPNKKAQVSYLATYPSYLGQLVECGLAAGYGPENFGVERIALSGEVASEGLKRRAQQLFGDVSFSEQYTMTETWPTVAMCCEQGHLHFEPLQALCEIVEPDKMTPVQPDEAGVLVVTPLPPHRTTTLLLRYNTEDIVYPINEPLTCSLHHLPATSKVLGKRKFALRHEQGWIYPRAVIEALESVDDVPLPARWGYWAVPQGIAVEVAVRANSRATYRKIEEALHAQGLSLQSLHLLVDPQRLRHPYPLRCDQREVGSTPPPRLHWLYPYEVLLRAKG